MRLPVRDGLVQPDFSRGIHKAAVVERHRATGNIGLGFWQWGLRRGAIATSVMHDSHNIAVIGANDPDMALAVNRVAEIGGGIVVAGEGKILPASPPCMGAITDAPPRGCRRVQQSRECGSNPLSRWFEPAAGRQDEAEHDAGPKRRAGGPTDLRLLNLLSEAIHAD